MKLTGKCKKDFEKWYLKEYYSRYTDKDFLEHQLFAFELLSFSKKYGILVDFFDSVDLIIEIYPILEYDNEKYTKVSYYRSNVQVLCEDLNLKDFGSEASTRNEAREKVIKKANEIYNQNYGK